MVKTLKKLQNQANCVQQKNERITSSSMHFKSAQEASKHKKVQIYAQEPISHKGKTYQYNLNSSDPRATEQNREYLVQRKLQQNRICRRQCLKRSQSDAAMVQQLVEQIAAMKKKTEMLRFCFKDLQKERDNLLSTLGRQKTESVYQAARIQEYQKPPLETLSYDKHFNVAISEVDITVPISNESSMGLNTWP